MKRSLPMLLVGLALSLTAVPSALATCVSAKCTDTVSIEQARAQIQATCGCQREGQTHRKYVKCVRSTLRFADITALIPQKGCRKLILKCEKASICGRPNAALCCSLKRNGKPKARIVRNPARCRNGSACGAFLGLYSKFDACADDGTCAGPVPTTTSTSSTTSTLPGPTTSTTAPPPTTTSTTEPSSSTTTTAPPATTTTTEPPTTTTTTEPETTTTTEPPTTTTTTTEPETTTTTSSTTTTTTP